MKKRFREITKFEVNPETDLQEYMDVGKPLIDFIFIKSDKVPVGKLQVTFNDRTKELWQIT